ncbi:MAG: TIGR01906 family membrane protein [Suipraeoptans sp.]
MKQKGIKLVAVIAMILLIFSVLITAFQVAVYGDSKYSFYREEYEKYEVTEALNMSLDQVMVVSNYMMRYLIGDEDELSITTKVDGEVQDFFNEQDRFHMEEVKDLFLGGLRLRNISLVISIILLIGIIIVSRKESMLILPKAFLISFVIYMIFAGVIGRLFAMDFNKYFTIFHEIFFNNDEWMFDYNTDYMIRMLPEGFFYDMLYRIIKVFAALLTAIGAVFTGLFVWRKHKDSL